MKITDEWREQLAEENPDAVLWDGYDVAILGTGVQANKPPVVVYSESRIIEILMTRDKMTEDEAIEFIDHNITGSMLGEHSPMLLRDA